MSRRDDSVRIRDMLDAAEAAIRVLGDCTAEELEDNEALSLAVPHAIEIVGEAASHVSREFCEAHPEIPWSDVTGMRHRIVHDYYAVDYVRVWITVRENLPPLITSLKAILAELDTP